MKLLVMTQETEPEGCESTSPGLMEEHDLNQATPHENEKESHASV